MRKPLLICITTLSLLSAFGQGCSDAGFCTMGAMKPDQLYRKDVALKLRSLELSYYSGKTTLSPTVESFTADASFTIKKTAFQVKALYQWVSGNLGRNGGFGDMSLGASRTLFAKENYSINATVGAKVPLGTGNAEDSKGRDFPMYYQVNLGSVDFVAGASLLSKTWLIATGIQLPVIHINNNQFDYEEWRDYPSWEYIKEHPLATDLKRGTDVMLRVERNFRFSNYNFNLGILNIYRVNKDQIRNPDTNEYVKLDGTTGFAITALAGFSYFFNVTSAVKLTYGLKLAERDVNPDGLTRHSVLNLAYVYRF